MNANRLWILAGLTAVTVALPGGLSAQQFPGSTSNRARLGGLRRTSLPTSTLPTLPASDRSATFGAAPTLARTPRLRVPVSRPPVSPYLNLLNTSRDDRITYLGIIRPQFQQQRLALRQEAELNRLQATLAAERADQVAARDALADQLQAAQFPERVKVVETGHPTRFLSTETRSSRSRGTGIENGHRVRFQSTGDYFPRR